MNIIIAQLKNDCRLHTYIVATYWLMLITIIGLFFSSNESIWQNHSELSTAIKPIILVFCITIFAADSASDPNSFWRTQPLSTSHLCLSKLVLLFSLIILPTVALHWVIIQSVAQGLNGYMALEPLIYFSNQALCAALLGSNIRRSKPGIIFVFALVAMVLTLIPTWLKYKFAFQLPSFEGNTAIIISAATSLLLLASLWFAYSRRNITYLTPVSAIAILVFWLSLQLVGPWHITSNPSQSKQLDLQTSLSESSAQLDVYESLPTHYIEATISVPKTVMKDYVFSSRSLTSNPAGLRESNTSEGGFDHGEFTFVHKQLGFATERDRILSPAKTWVGFIEQDEWNNTAHSLSTVNIELAYSEPIVSVLSDQTFLSANEFVHRNYKFRLNSQISGNAKALVSLNGYATEKPILGAIIYRPDLKELVHTQAINFGGSTRSIGLLSRPKIQTLQFKWQPQFNRDQTSKKNSLGYRSLVNRPNKEWFVKARVLVYRVDLTKPIVTKLVIEDVSLDNLATEP